MARPEASPFTRSRLPLYDQVASELRQRIRDGYWATGGQLPNMDDLAQEFGVARVTVRQALNLLEEEGLIWRRQGKGTFVARRPLDERWLRVGTQWASLMRMIEGTRMRLVDSRDVLRPDEWRSEDGEPADAYRYLHRVHAKDGRPYCDIGIFLASDIYALAPKEFERRLVLEVLDRLPDVEIGSAHQTLTIGRADMETARVLDMDVGGPVAEVHRVITDRSNRAIYVAEIVYRGDFVRLDMQLRGSEPNTGGGAQS